MNEDAFWRPLASSLKGDVTSNPGVRGAYSTDASVYLQFPRAVAFPRCHDDVVTIVQFCQRQGVSIVGRGAGTSLSGQAIGPGLVVDFSRYLNQILHIDTERRLATVQSGVVLDELNRRLSAHGLHFAPDPATASRATIGGMIGNNACGTRSIRYGRTCDAVESLRLVLDDGCELRTAWLTAEEWRQAARFSDRSGAIYRTIDTLLSPCVSEIQRRIPKLPRIAAGYSVARLLDAGPSRSLSDLIVGSEGTLALATEATVRLHPLPRFTRLVISAFESIEQALESLPRVLSHRPSAAELLDDVLIEEAVHNAATRDLAQTIAHGGHVPRAVLMVEFFGDTETEAERAAADYMVAVTDESATAAHHVLQTQRDQRAAWDVRRLGLGLISNLPGKRKGLALIEDACLPIEQMAEYHRFVYQMGREWDMGVSTYGHASVGVLHYKVMLDLHQREDRQRMRAMAEACFEKCLALGGVFSGEHGDGIVRAEFLKRQFGPQIYSLFVAIKRLFDPRGILNPGRKIEAPPLDSLLRYGDSEAERIQYLERTARVRSHFRFAAQGGLVGAVEQCNGVGACRQLHRGTMCPSYRATRDERDSTRGRANLLRLAIAGQLDPPGLANPDVHGALELCLSCKACQSECPNAVDLARLKSESLQARWESEGLPPATRFFGTMADRLGSLQRIAGVVNWVSRRRWIRWLIERRYGIDRRRALPRLARRSFDAWWRAQRLAVVGDQPAVALMVDAWNRYLEPENGIAAVELLRGLGYQVELIRSVDALRARISVGLLEEARKLGSALYADLGAVAKRGLPILCLEPSEASALVDDLPDLVEDPATARAVVGATRLLDDFLAEGLAAQRVALTAVNGGEGRRVFVHPHCHQRAIFSARSTVDILQAAGYEASLTDWGCCGMAGSFGYTHFDVSRRIAEQQFLPGLRAAESTGATVVATGTSCRQQARDLAGISSPHWLPLVRAGRAR